MADQSVRIVNLPDSGSPEAIAFELWKYLNSSNETREERLQFYVQCLEATRGVGRYRITG